MARVRRGIVCLLVALVGLGAAGLAGASEGDAEPSPAPAAADRPAPSPSLPAVTEHDLDPAVRAASVESAPRAVTEVVVLQVLAGSLTLATPSVTVALRREGDGRWAGDLPPVRVVDARGSLVGWQVRWALTDVVVDGHAARGSLVVAPGTPVVVDGLSAGLHSGRRGSHVLFAAEAGTGGGTYEAGAGLSLDLGDRDAGTVTVTLTFAIR